MQSDKIIAGIDIESESVQISWFGGRLSEPETVSMQVGVDKFKIPFALFYREEQKDYQFGHAAVECHINNEKGVFIPSVYNSCINKKDEYIEEKTVLSTELMNIFMEKLIHMVEMISDAKEIYSIVYTAFEMNENMVKVLKEASKAYSDRGTKLYFKTYDETYLSYLFNGPSEFYARDSVLLYFHKGQLDVYHVMINKKYRPLMIKLEHKKIDGFEAVDEVLFCSDEDKEQLDCHFLEIVKNLFGRTLISSVFLTGDGFDNGWMKESLRFLCQGRRVFQGKNLFTKGACNYIMQEIHNDKKYHYDGSARLKYEITIPMWQQGNSKTYEVYDGKGDWYEVDKTFECLLDECDDISIDIVNTENPQEKKTEHLKLEDLPKRPSLATKIKVDIMMKGRNKLYICARDLGLGEFFEATDRIWEKEILLNS